MEFGGSKTTPARTSVARATVSSSHRSGTRGLRPSIYLREDTDGLISGTGRKEELPSRTRVGKPMDNHISEVLNGWSNNYAG